MDREASEALFFLNTRFASQALFTEGRLDNNPALVSKLEVVLGLHHILDCDVRKSKNVDAHKKITENALNLLERLSPYVKQLEEVKSDKASKAVGLGCYKKIEELRVAAAVKGYYKDYEALVERFNTVLTLRNLRGTADERKAKSGFMMLADVWNSIRP